MIGNRFSLTCELPRRDVPKSLSAAATVPSAGARAYVKTSNRAVERSTAARHREAGALRVKIATPGRDT